MTREERCWYHMFMNDPCQNRGEWHWPSGPSQFVREMRWCSVHKHETDVRLIQDAPTEQEEGRSE